MSITIKKAKIKDIRGEQYSNCFIQIENNKVYFGGLPVKELRKSENTNSKYYYDIISKTGLNLGIIALTDDTANRIIKFLAL